MANKKLKQSSITPEQRITLYHPLTYTVKRVNDTVYSAQSEYTGLEFHAKKHDTFWRVHSPTGTFWDVSFQGECLCPDYYRAEKCNRLCKHQAVVVAVIEFIKREGSPRKTTEELRQELKEMLG